MLFEISEKAINIDAMYWDKMEDTSLWTANRLDCLNLIIPLQIIKQKNHTRIMFLHKNGFGYVDPNVFMKYCISID